MGGAIVATPLTESSEPSCVLSVDLSESGYVAAGYVGDQPALWQSLDGRPWTEMSLDTSPSVLGGRVQSLTHSDALDLAVGDGPTTSDLLAPSIAVFWGDNVGPR